jgi:capsular exopolysaccharide synthesis family protein
MSKIFDALQGARGEVSDLLPSLFDDPVPPPYHVPTTPAATTTASESVVEPQLVVEQPVVSHLFGEGLVVEQPVELPRVAQARVEQPRIEQGRVIQPKIEQPMVAQAVVEPLARETSAPPAIAPVPPHVRSGILRMPLVVGSSEPLLPFENQEEPAAEQYRIARTKLAHHPKNPKMIVISSASSGDGKTFTAINLAGVLSLKGDSKVLLLDGDFRRSSMHSRLGLPSSPGLAEVVTGECAFEDAVIQADQFPNLYILVRGDTKTINPSELLDSPGWRLLCRRTREEFQYIIIDSPPVAAVADFELIQVAADGTILVVRPEHTKRSACLQAIDAIPKDKFLGVMLNCAEDWFFNKHSSYGYGYGYNDKPAAARESKLA